MPLNLSKNLLRKNQVGLWCYFGQVGSHLRLLLENFLKQGLFIDFSVEIAIVDSDLRTLASCHLLAHRRFVAQHFAFPG